MGKLKYPWITHDPWIYTHGCGYFFTHIHGRYGLEFEGGKSMGMGAGQPMDYPCSALVPLTFTEQDIREAILALEKVRCSCTPIAVDANVSHFQILKLSNKVWNNTTIRHELEKLAK